MEQAVKELQGDLADAFTRESERVQLQQVEIAGLQEKVSSLEVSKNELSGEISTLKAESRKLNDDLKETRANLARADELRAELLDAKVAAEQKLSKTTGDLQHANDLKKELDARASAISAGSEEQESKRIQLQEVNQRLTTTIAALETKMAVQKTELETAVETARRLEVTREELLGKLTKQLEVQNQLNEDIGKAMTLITNLDSVVKKWLRALQNYQHFTQLPQYANDIAQLRRDLQAAGKGLSVGAASSGNT